MLAEQVSAAVQHGSVSLLEGFANPRCWIIEGASAYIYSELIDKLDGAVGEKLSSGWI